MPIILTTAVLSLSRRSQTLSGRSRRAEGQARGTGLRTETGLTTQRVIVQRGIGWPRQTVRFGCAVRTGPDFRNDVEVSSFPNLQYHGGVGGGGSMAGVYTSRLREFEASLLYWVLLVSGAPRSNMWCWSVVHPADAGAAAANVPAPALVCPCPSQPQLCFTHWSMTNASS